ncbi:MAG: macro domain-containing protein, partial [Lachnospiraceae bacterium]|nr:macro domain-containing protein [Lachnospiraceae bacterium]
MPFQIVRNDITKMQVDAIVNTASPYPGYGDGVDTAVYASAGPELMEVREKIGEIEPGSSVMTPGFGLPVRFIIHTVGTFWEDGKSGEEDVIRSCYRSVFELAVSNQIETLAIPLLASGSYGFPKGIALRIALSEIESFLSEHDLTVYLVVFDEKSYSLSAELYGDIESYISDHYVEQKTEEEYPFMGVTMAGRPAPTAMPAMTAPQAMSAPFAKTGMPDMLS